MLNSFFSLFHKKTLDEWITCAFPESSRAFAKAFFSNSANMDLVVDFQEYSIRDADGFFANAAFSFYEEPRRDQEDGIWMLCHDSLRSSNDIAFDTKSNHVIQYKDKSVIVLAESFSKFIERLVISGLLELPDPLTIPPLCDEKKERLSAIFPSEDRQMAWNIYAAYENNELIFEIDCTPKGCPYLTLDSGLSFYPDVTKDNFFTRGHFFFIYPFIKPPKKFVPNSDWWYICFEIGDEDIGPNNGSILVNKNTGHIYYRGCCIHDPPSLFYLIFGDITKHTEQEEWCFFMLADSIEDFVAKCRSAGATLFTECPQSAK